MLSQKIIGYRSCSTHLNSEPIFLNVAVFYAAALDGFFFKTQPFRSFQPFRSIHWKPKPFLNPFRSFCHKPLHQNGAVKERFCLKGPVKRRVWIKATM